MAHASKSILINKSQAEVFNFLADGLNNPKWRPAVTDISLIEGTSSTVGSVYKQGVRGPFGKRLDADYKIIEIKPNSKITFQVIRGPASPTGVFELIGQSNSTQLTFSLDFQPTGFAKLMGPMIQKTMNLEVKTLQNLKEFLEK